MLAVLAAACTMPDARSDDDKPRRKKRPRLAPFPNKLQEIVAGNPDVVTWDERTRALVVRDPRRLSAEIMPKYFNTNGGDGLLKSFTRQLNYYGFHRVTAAQPQKRARAASFDDKLEDDSPFLLLHLRGLPDDLNDDTLLAVSRTLFGDEALVFVNKDPSIKSVDDFARLVRFEKAANRVTLTPLPHQRLATAC